MNNGSGKLSVIITTAIITLIVTISAFFLWQYQSQTPSETDNWLIYSSNEGFSFQYPEGYTVNENVDPENSEITNVFIVEDENRPPVMQINVSKNSVSFSLWEGIPWQGFPEIISTFKSK